MSSTATTNTNSADAVSCCLRFSAVIKYFKYMYSTVLLLFSIALVMNNVFTGNSAAVIEYNNPPIVCCVVFWFLICWLALMEGGQGCLVGLKPIPQKKYKSSHPRSYQSCRIAYRGDNLERFIIGRQFLVVLVIFLINFNGAAIPAVANENSSISFLPVWVTTIFLDNGLAMIITTIDIAQLPAQVNAAVAMLDFINNYVMIATTIISLVIEFSGLLHCVYLVQYGFASITKTKVESQEESSRTFIGKCFFWLRVLISVCILAFALAVTITALLEGKSGMWEGVSPVLSLVIFFTLLCLVGLMEGMQIAAFALMNMPPEEVLAQSPIASKNCSLMYEGNNLQSFLVGRQIFVASLMFIVAKIASISIDSDAGQMNIFNVSDSVQAFFDTGLLGAVILTIIGSLAWRIIASSFPLLFMSNPIIFVIIQGCFILEGTGICSAAWIIASTSRKVFRLKSDDEYLSHMNKDNDNNNSDNSTDINTDEGETKKTVIVSSRDLRISEDEEGLFMETEMKKMEKSLLRTSRLSAIISTQDLDQVMKELGNEYGKSDENDDDEDDDDEEGFRYFQSVI